MCVCVCACACTCVCVRSYVYTQTQWNTAQPLKNTWYLQQLGCISIIMQSEGSYTNKECTIYFHLQGMLENTIESTMIKSVSVVGRHREGGRIGMEGLQRSVNKILQVMDIFFILIVISFKNIFMRQNLSNCIL